MTAVVGILNKQGVAIAADSAVTVTTTFGQKKVYNSANKIFTLSKYAPIGIAIYNSAQFMGVPWETIIKQYRHELGDRKFDNVKHYVSHFFLWMQRKNYFKQEIEGSENLLLQDFANFIFKLINSVRGNQNRSNILNQIIQKFKDENQKINPLSDFIYHDFSQCQIFLDANYQSIANQIINQNNILLNGIDLNALSLKNSIIESFILYLKKAKFFSFTGLIFTGFGENELFPSMISLNISYVLDGKLRFYEDMSVKINQRNNAAIRPFAQTDVIDTILRGISPELAQLSDSSIREFFAKFKNEISTQLELDANQKTRLEAVNVDEFMNSYSSSIKSIIVTKYVQPLMGAVGILSKEDLAEMAESLVYLTYLKRRFSMADESVGGPVDIAVITKGDGFIWIKRKHYFDAELNQSFFKKYFN